MQAPRPRRSSVARCVSLFSLLVPVALLCSCKSAPKPDADQANQVAMWLNSVPQLKSLNVSNAEIDELSKAHQAGLTDPSSVVLIQLAREHKAPFADGQAVANLLKAGSSEETVLELARLNQLGPFAGEARAIRLAGLSDKIILAVARRRSQGLAALPGGKLGELKNVGASEATILEMVQKGDTDEIASRFIAQRERAAGGHNFVYQTRAHHR
jgi:hypothetical protein